MHLKKLVLPRSTNYHEQTSKFGNKSTSDSHINIITLNGCICLKVILAQSELASLWNIVMFIGGESKALGHDLVSKLVSWCYYVIVNI